MTDLNVKVEETKGRNRYVMVAVFEPILIISLCILMAIVSLQVSITSDKLNRIEHKVNCIMTGEDVKEAQE